MLSKQKDNVVNDEKSNENIDNVSVTDTSKLSNTTKTKIDVNLQSNEELMEMGEKITTPTIPLSSAVQSKTIKNKYLLEIHKK